MHSLFSADNDLAQPGLTVVGIDSDMIDESNEESEERDDLDVCALCDNGGNVTWYDIFFIWVNLF